MKKKLTYYAVIVLIAVNTFLYYADIKNEEMKHTYILDRIEELGENIPDADGFEKIDRALTGRNFNKKWIYSKKTDSLWFKYIKAPPTYSLSKYNYFLQKVFRETGSDVLKAAEFELSSKLVFDLNICDSIKAVVELRIDKDLPGDSIRIGGNAAVAVAGMGDVWGPEWIMEMMQSQIPLAVGIIPGRWASGSVMQEAEKNGKEIIISLPMEPLKGNIDREKFRILKGMNEYTIDVVLDELSGIFSKPSGIINLKGTKVSADFETMDALFRNLKKRRLFYLEPSNEISFNGLLSEHYGIPDVASEIIYFEAGTDTSLIRELFKGIEEGRDVLIVTDPDEQNCRFILSNFGNHPEINVITVSEFVSLKEI